MNDYVTRNGSESRCASIITAILFIMMLCGMKMPCHGQSSYSGLVTSADSLQNIGEYSRAIRMFKEAENKCLDSQGEYCRDMRYILGSMATCCQFTDEYDLYLECLKRIDRIGGAIGYEEELPESFLCYEISRGLIWQEATNQDLEYAKSCMTRGRSRDRDPQRAPYWEALSHKLNYITAARSADIKAAGPLLEAEYRYFRTECGLPKAEISGELLESALLLSRNMQDRSLNKESLDMLEEANHELERITPGFYSVDLEVGKMYALANMEDSESCGRCIAIGERILSETEEDAINFPLLSAARYNIGRCYNTLEEYQEALDMLRSIYTGTYSEKLADTDTSFIQFEIAYSLMGLGRDRESEALCREILQKGNPQGSILAGIYWVLAAIANHGQNKLELSFIEDSVNAYGHMGHEDPKYAETFVVFAQRYAEFQQNESALVLLDKALRLFEMRGDVNTIPYYTALSQKAMLSAMVGNPETFMAAVRQLNSDAEGLKKAVAGSDDYDSVTYLLAMVHSAMSTAFGMANYYFRSDVDNADVSAGQKEEARRMLKDAQSQSLGMVATLNEDVMSWLRANNPDRLGALYHNCALIYNCLEEYDEGIEYINRVLSEIPPACGMYATLAELRDIMQLRKDGPSMHIDFIKEKYEKDKKYLKEMLGGMSSGRRAEMWRQFYGNMSGYVEYARLARDDSRMSEIAYNAILLSKGLLLQSEADFASRILKTNDGALIDRYNLWVDQTETDPEEAAKTERELLRTLGKDFDSELFNTSWTDVRKNLKENEYAIEFRASDSYGTRSYLAFVVGASYPSPKCVEVCKETDLNKPEDGREWDYSALSRTVWSGLDGIIPTGSTVYFSPDQQLHSLPIENLPDYEAPGSMIGDRWDLYRVSSTRQLIQRRPVSRDGKVELFGGLDYTVDKNELISDYKANTSRYRSLGMDAGDLRGALASVAVLPGSKREISQIAGMLSANRTPYLEYSGRKGTESCFKAYAGKAGNILHISTHGFYIASATEGNRLLRILGIDGEYDTYEAALRRSGLMMAGVNETIHGRVKPTECEDGLLTAKEIAALDLGNTDLAVLSACETGVGAISGDGVFGLQRGFKLAGVKSVMMTLWKVDDNATERLMTEFYKHWLDGGNARDALAKAQDAIRHTPGWEDPKYWAGFILLDFFN